MDTVPEAAAGPPSRDVGAAAIGMTRLHLFSAPFPCRSATQHMTTAHSRLPPARPAALELELKYC
jgi:hypothetical protein